MLLADVAVLSDEFILKTKNNFNMILFSIFIIWLAFLANLEFKASTNKTTYKFNYNGLLWVALDYYTITKYDSNDKVLKWIEFSRTEHFR